MTVFFRKVDGGFALSTEYTDERVYTAQTLDEALQYFKKQFGIIPTKLCELER